MPFCKLAGAMESPNGPSVAVHSFHHPKAPREAPSPNLPNKKARFAAGFLLLSVGRFNSIAPATLG